MMKTVIDQVIDRAHERGILFDVDLIEVVFTSYSNSNEKSTKYKTDFSIRELDELVDCYNDFIKFGRSRGSLYNLFNSILKAN